MADFWKDVLIGDKSVQRPSLNLYGTEYVLAPLAQPELDIFNAQMPTLLAAPTSIERQIQMQRIDAYISAIRAVKQKLNGSPAFKGISAAGDTELGFQPIRPQFIRLANAYRVNWVTNVVANVWTFIAGNAAGNAGFTCGQEFGLVITHIKSLTTPTPNESEIRIVTERAQINPVSVRSLRLGDNINGVAIYPIPTVITIPLASLQVQVKGDLGGNTELEYGGFVIGLGRALNELVPTWLPLT
ncbi:MAG: hypothetical protein V2A77_00555 [Pseudomonadota bacterium]